MIFPENIPAVLSKPGHILEAVKILEHLPTKDGPDEVTLGDRRQPGRIVVFQGGDLRTGAESPLRDFVKTLDVNFEVSIVRNRNYGKFRTAHLVGEYMSFREG